MKNLIIAIDQSTSATKAMLFNERCEILRRVNVTHEQYYPRTGWVEHDVEEIYRNVLKALLSWSKRKRQTICIRWLSLINARQWSYGNKQYG